MRFPSTTVEEGWRFNSVMSGIPCPDPDVPHWRKRGRQHVLSRARSLIVGGGRDVSNQPPGHKLKDVRMKHSCCPHAREKCVIGTFVNRTGKKGAFGVTNVLKNFLSILLTAQKHEAAFGEDNMNSGEKKETNMRP